MKAAIRYIEGDPGKVFDLRLPLGQVAEAYRAVDGPRASSANVDHMSKVSGNDLIDDVTPGDIIAVDRGSGEQPYKVVFKDLSDAGYLITFETDSGETFQLDMPAGTRVTRSLEAKWESAQSPTPSPEH